MLKVKIIEEAEFLIDADTEDACNFLDRSSIKDVKNRCDIEDIPLSISSSWEILSSGDSDKKGIAI